MNPYRILVVDDNIMEIDCVRFLINKFSMPLEVYSTQSSAEALRMLQSSPFQILLTDIKMPLLDGLELAREAQALNPEIVTILFSGYSEFDYAHDAISLGIHEYLLKPIDPEDLKQTLNHVVLKLEQNRKSHRQSLYLRRHLLFTLLNGGSIQRSQEFLLPYSWMMTLNFSQDYLGAEGEAFVDRLQRALSYAFDFVSFYPNQGVAFFHGELPEEAALLREARDAVCRLSSCPCDVRGGRINGMNDIFACYQRLEAVDEEETPVLSPEEILDASRRGDMQPFREYYSARRARMGSDAYERYTLVKLLCGIVGLRAGQAPEREIVSQVFSIRTPEELDQVVTDLINEENLDKGQENDQRVVSIKRYVAIHYADDLGLNEIAAAFHFSASYLCRIFKQKTGVTLIQYINDLRMSKAIALLETTQMKVSQIAQGVGYRSASYFCQRFRDCYGLSPDAHRQRQAHRPDAEG